MPAGNNVEAFYLKYVTLHKKKPAPVKPAMLSSRFLGVPKFVRDAVKKGKK